MKKSKLVLLPLLLLGSMSGLAAMTSCSKVTFAFAEDTKSTLYVRGTLDLSDAVTANYEGKAAEGYTWSSSDESIATVSEDGLVSGVAVGTAKIVVTSTFKAKYTAEFEVTVMERPTLPTAQVKTIDELNAMTASDTQHLYEASGVVTGIVDSDYGNFYLNSTDGTSKIQVWGSTLSASSIDWDANCTKLVFSNPKDFKAKDGFFANLHNGDRLTIVGLFVLYGSTTEITGYVKGGLEGIDAAANHTDYSASITTTKVAETDQDATLSKTEGIYFGEQLEITVPAVENYKPVVKVNDATISADSEGKYTFVAGFKNVVSVSYELAVSYEYAKLEKFDVVSGYTAYTAYDAAAVLTKLKASSDAETTALTAISTTGTTNPLLGGNGTISGTSWDCWNCLKLGSTSKSSNITLTFAEGTKIGKIVCKAFGWVGKVSNLSVNGSAAQTVVAPKTAAEAQDGACAEEYTFTFTPSNEVVLSADLAVLITEFTVYTATVVAA